MMSSKQYVEDTSVKGRREEIDIKVNRVIDLLKKEDLDALYLTRQSNFAWITAGANGVVTSCVEDSAAAILITRDGGRYAITNIIEESRMREEQQLEELGFKILSQAWYENKNEEMIVNIVGNIERVGADVHFSKAKMIQDKILPLHYSLTYNEICRYQYLGDNMSAALEAYLATVKPGMTEYEIAGGVANALWPKGIDQVLFLVATGDRIRNYRHAIPSWSKLDNTLMVSCNGRYKGLITTTTRLVYLGTPPASLLEQFDVNVEIECRMIEATKPGVDELVPHMLGKKLYEEAGFGVMYYKHAQGGPQSYYNRYYNISETAHNITQPNQCYCYQPVIDGTKTEDAFIATEQGPLMITKPMSFPKVTKTINGVTIEKPGMLVID
jgi:Xaa-Pro dipeptidase